MNDLSHALGSDSIADLRNAVAALERRVALLEGGRSGAPASMPAPAAAPAPQDPARARSLAAPLVLALLGRSLLTLAGAFLLRALTERGALPGLAGFALGLAYALVLVLLSWRSAGRGDNLGANVHGMIAVIVAYPFVWETTARTALASPLGGAGALAGLTAAGLAAAWARRLRFQYWAFTLAALATALAIPFGVGASVPYAWLLLALGAASVLFSYNRSWYLARWPVALAADLVLLRLAVMTSNPDGAVVGGQAVSAGSIVLLCLALMITYLGLFTYRALVQGRGVRAFDVVQSALVLAVGYGGAGYAARQAGGMPALGWAGFLAAAAYYGVAFTVVRTRQGRGRSFFYLASLALLFLVLGSRMVVSGQGLAWAWIGLGLAAAVLGGRYDRVTLRAHSAVYLTLAAFQTGLAAAAAHAFLGDPAHAWPMLGPSALVALLATCAGYGVLVRTAPGPVANARRVPRFAVALLCLAGAGWAAVTLLLQLAGGSPPAANPAAVAVVRTGVLAATAMLLALAARRTDLTELGWLVYPALVVGLAKLVLEDLPRGTPMTLTIGFALFGAALITAPRMLHGGRRRGAGPD